jgi:hypothetical protein
MISKPFMLIRILEYTCNMVVHIHSKYTFTIHPSLFLKIYKIHLCIFIRLHVNWSHLQLMGHKLFFLDEHQNSCKLIVM